MIILLGKSLSRRKATIPNFGKFCYSKNSIACFYYLIILSTNLPILKYHNEVLFHPPLLTLNQVLAKRNFLANVFITKNFKLYRIKFTLVLIGFCNFLLFLEHNYDSLKFIILNINLYYKKINI